MNENDGNYLRRGVYAVAGLMGRWAGGLQMGHQGPVDRGAEVAAAITLFDFLLRVIAEGR